MTSLFEDNRVPLPAGLLDGGARNAEEFRAVAEDRLVAGAGVVLFEGGAALCEQAERASLALSGALGRVVAQDAAGTLVRPVRYTGTRVGEGRSSRYADSRDGGNLHTDGAEAAPPVPDYFTLLCVRPAARGGRLQLVRLDDLLRRLADPEAAVLAGDFYFDRRGDAGTGESPVVRKPVLFRDNGRPSVTYLRRYIDIAHARPEVPNLTPAQRRALDAFDRLLGCAELVAEYRMRPGEFLVVDNKRFLHGRTAFDDGADAGTDGGRLLLRTWVHREAASVAAHAGQ